MPMHDKTIEKTAAAMYDPKMPYHNFGHAITVTRHSESIIKKCRQEGIELDEKVVYYALIFHDAGYQDDHAAKGFDSKEAYSAALAAEALREHGESESTIKKVETAILSTHIDGKCQSNEDKAVRASDLSGLAAEYSVFKLNALRLKEENELMLGEVVEWDEWTRGVKKTLELFLREDLELTSDYYDKDGKSVFHERTRQNLRTLLADKSPDIEE